MPKLDPRKFLLIQVFRCFIDEMYDIVNEYCAIIFIHGGGGSLMFVYHQNILDSWGRNFLNSWFV